MALPSEFSNLERFSDWCLATEPERYAKRLASTMEEMQAFYDAAFPRMDDVIAYCDKFPLDDLPEDACTLMHMMQSMVMVSFRWKPGSSPSARQRRGLGRLHQGAGDLTRADAQIRPAA